MFTQDFDAMIDMYIEQLEDQLTQDEPLFLLQDYKPEQALQFS